MRAILMDGPGDEGVMRLGEAPAPAIEPGSMRIRVVATSVNRADLLQRQGLYPPPPGASEILGLECAGEVIETAPDVAGWSVSDRAMALLAGGGYAEEVVVDAGCALPVPDALSLEAAAAVSEVFLTAFLNLFQLGGLPDAGTALVHGGGGGVGTAAIQLVKEAGGNLAVTAGSDDKCRRCRALGADVAVNYRSEDFAAAARQLGGGRGVDVVLDCVGAPYFERNLRALAVGGRLVMIGLMGGAKCEVGLGPLLARRLHVIGSTLRSRSAAEKAEIVTGFRSRFGEALERGRIEPVVDRTLPLAQAPEAHRVVKAGEHFGKVVLRVS
jgi:putative PIG3 family NAD(P)H quinone oxidoreductase